MCDKKYLMSKEVRSFHPIQQTVTVDDNNLRNVRGSLFFSSRTSVESRLSLGCTRVGCTCHFARDARADHTRPSSAYL